MYEGSSAENKKLQLEITRLLHGLGMPSHIKGYRYIREGIRLVYKNEVTYKASNLYTRVADIFGTTSSRVEKSIRYAIEISWNRANWDLMEEIFGYSVDVNKSKPTNSEYIMTIVDRLSLTYMN